MQPEAVFFDRVDERRAVDGLAESARQGGSGALVFYGEAGMGKTALLDYASSVADLRVARISGIETEQEFGFAALYRLLLPFLDDLGQIPASQQVALRSAFGLPDGGPPDRFLVGLAALSLLAVQSAKWPVLCVVDDAQWIDQESLRTVAFIGRRLRAEGIVLLLGVRTSFDVPSELAGIPSIEVTGLPDEAAIDLLKQVAGRELDSTVTKYVLTEMNGCPLALWELGKDLATRPIADRVLLDGTVAIGRRLEDHFFEQIASLPPHTQLFLLVAASETSGDRGLIRRVALELGSSADAEMEAHRRRLLILGPGIRFRHPLIRSTVYARADPEQRRVVHRTLARVMDRRTHPDRWARHVVLGADRPNELLAVELEAVSHIAQARGGYSAQTTLLVQAAHLSESLQARSVRLLGAAAAGLNAGVHPYAAELLDQAEAHLSDPASVAEACHLRGRLSTGLAQAPKAPALLLAAARSFLPLSVSRTREVLLEAFDAYVASAHLTVGVSASDIASLAEKTSTTAGSLAVQDHLLEGTAAFFSGNRSRAYEHFRRTAQFIRAGEVTNDQIGQWFFVGSVMTEIFDDTTYGLWMARTEAYARENGALYLLVSSLIGQMHADVRAGRIRAAAGRHAEALDVAGAIGLAEHYLHLDNIVRAWAGDEEGTRTTTAATIEANTRIGSGSPVVLAHWALAVLHMGAARYREALVETDFICAQNVIGFSTAEALPLVVEAGVRSGQREKAERALVDLESGALASGTPWALGLLARSRALLIDGLEAERHFQEAISLLQQTSVATDLARARLLYGEWLRRERRRIDARTQLRMAHDFFTEIGAMGYAKRAEIELLATGARTRVRSVEHATDLTPQERRVAQMASEGFTNQEIASQLFISSATVEYHLSKIFRKLDIGSRRRLKNALAALDSELP